MFARVIAIALCVCLEATALSESAGNVKERKLQDLVGRASVEKLRVRLLEVNTDIQGKGLKNFPGSSERLLTGYAYGEFYDWDLYFENLYLSYYGVGQYNFSNFKMFFARQLPDGFVSRSLIMARPTQMFKPFLAQIAVLGSRQQGDDFDWLRAQYYGQLKRYLDRWFRYDSDHNGLPVWNSSDASGMDNQYSRAGEVDVYQDEGVDLECYLVRELRAMSVIAGRLGELDDAKEFTRHADQLSSRINAVLWDEKDGFYYDRNEKTGQRVRVKSVAGFLPLWAGVATPERARRIIKEHLLNPNEFWLKYPVASYARTELDYYQGSKTRKGECNWRGTTWIPTNYMIFHGLMKYGYRDIAKELAMKTFRLALDENPATREYYDADSGKGNGMNPFWGWSALAYAMPLEFATNYDPTDLSAPVIPLLTRALDVRFDASAKEIPR